VNFAFSVVRRAKSELEDEFINKQDFEIEEHMTTSMVASFACSPPRDSV
jgi:hypothetical protein